MKKEILVTCWVQGTQKVPVHLHLDANGFRVADLSQNLEALEPELAAFTPHGKVVIEDITFPTHFMPFFSGPAFGKDEVRRFLKIKEQPISAISLHQSPSHSSHPRLEVCYLSLLGGIDIVVNPFSGDLEWEAFLEHLRMLLNEQKNCTIRTKKRSLFVPGLPHLKGEDLREYILSSQEQGIRGVMIDIGIMGFKGLQAMKTFSSGIGVLIAVTGWEKLLMVNPHIHVSKKLMMKMLRLAGADMVYLAASDPDLSNLARVLTNHQDKTLRNFRAGFPLIGPLRNITEVETIVKSCGYDVILETQDLITNHPKGIKAGAEAFVAAIDAAFRGIHQTI